MDNGSRQRCRAVRKVYSVSPKKLLAL